MTKENLEKLLNDAAKKCGISESFSVVFSNMPVCDFQCNSCFSVGKILKINPFDLAEKIVEKIKSNECFEFAVARPGFININLTEKGVEKLAREIFEVKYPKQSEHIFIDYGGPNLGKAMHIGHMRSFNIGEALKRLYRKLGYKVTSDIFFGDWGLPLGLIMAMLEKEGTLDKYISGQLPLTIEVMNQAYPQANKLKELDSSFNARAQTLTLAFQNKTQPYYDFWKKLREVSVAEVKKVCKLLNADFDLWKGESDANDYIDTVVKIFKEKGLARQSEGALVVDVAEPGEQIPIPKKTEDEVQRYENPMPPLIIQKSNGGDLYATSDIATIYYRNKLYNPDIIQYLTDVRQSQRFVQIFRACKKSGISPSTQQLWHTAFGTMNGKDGKAFKTRSGGNVSLLELFEMVQDKVEEKLKQNNVDFDAGLKRKIANSAIKFADLSNVVEKDYIFDIDKFTSFEGKTGPYILYTACRIKSILSKTQQFDLNFNFYSKEQKNVVINLARLQQSYKSAFYERGLSSICNALFELTRAFSTFYNYEKILAEDDKGKRDIKLSLCKLTLKEIISACDTLAIEIPDKM